MENIIIVILVFMAINMPTSKADTLCWQFFNGPIYCYATFTIGNNHVEIWTKGGKVLKYKQTRISRS